jgi:2-iminobutanoate/2-iminopropanoate deaminase
MPTQPFQKDGSLIALAQGIGADTLSIVRADAAEGRRAKQSLKTGGSQMLPRLAFACVTAIAMASSFSFAQAPSPNGVKTLNPPGAIKAEGTWSLGARAGDFVFVAGMQGVDPATNTLVQDPYARIRQAFLNIRLIAQSEGASLQDCVRLTVYVSDLHRFAPMVDKVQAELWSKPPYPPRTMIEVQRLFDDDIVEIDSIFYAPARR